MVKCSFSEIVTVKTLFSQKPRVNGNVIKKGDFVISGKVTPLEKYSEEIYSPLAWGKDDTSHGQ